MDRVKGEVNGPYRYWESVLATAHVKVLRWNVHGLHEA